MSDANDRTMRAQVAADQIDRAARALGIADVMLGAPDFDQPEVERQLLDALKLTLNALASLRGPSPARKSSSDPV
jgi:hypothetical protein